MATNYPNALDTVLSTLPNNKQDSTPTAGDHYLHHNNLADAVIAVETVLGTNPNGSYSTVAAAILNKVDLSPTSSQVIQGTGDIVGLVVKATSAQNTANVFEMRLSNNAIGAFIDKLGNFNAQSIKIQGSAISAANLSNGTTGSGAVVLATALNAYAPLNTPTFTGVPAAPTAVVDTNTTQLATTAFVLGQASSSQPAMDGSVAVGTSTRWARADHIHPTNTALLAKAGGTMTGLLILASQGIQFNDGSTMTSASTTTYGTSFPGSPLNGREHILVDSTTNPSYIWRFRYNANSTSPYKWEFIGGAPLIINGQAYGSLGHTGDYDFMAKAWADNGNTTSGGDLTTNLRLSDGVTNVIVDSSVDNGVASPYSGTSARGASLAILMGRATGVPSSYSVVISGPAGQNPQISILPVRFSN